MVEAEAPRCPLCGLNLTFFNVIQREQHGDACLDRLEQEAGDAPQDNPRRITKTSREEVLPIKIEENSTYESSLNSEIELISLPERALSIENPPNATNETLKFGAQVSGSPDMKLTTMASAHNNFDKASISGENSVILRSSDSFDVVGNSIAEEPRTKAPKWETPSLLSLQSSSAPAAAPEHTISSTSTSAPSKKREPSQSEGGNDRRRRTMPFYKVLEFGTGKVAVDAFSYGAIDGVNAYFLTHFHSDHYGGLTKNWRHGPIYCSPATARLVHLKLGVPLEMLREISIGIENKVNIDGLDVVFLDANHCPGAVVILFDTHTLHTGDFRASKELLGQIKRLTPRLERLYLDTTYLDPNRLFPSQQLVVKTCASLATGAQAERGPRSWFTKPRPQRVLVMVGTYTIGKERLAIEIAHALKSKIWATTQKRRILAALGEPELDSLLDVNDGLECQVHLAPMRDLSIAKLEEKWKFLQKHYTQLIAFVPTGWTWSKSEAAKDFTEASLLRRAVTRGPIRILKVPYSEHSSFSELEEFCRGIATSHLIATVPSPNLHILNDWETL